MVEFVTQWTERADDSPGALARLLQGYGLPAILGHDDPFALLLSGILEAPAEDRAKMKAEAARRTALLLKTRPDLHRPGNRPDELLYNLFMFCAGLSEPGPLGGPLREIYEHHRDHPDIGLDQTSGRALRAALIHNQSDDGLSPLWKRFWSGTVDPVLSGTPFDGFEGALYMPDVESGVAVGRPAMDPLGESLAAMARVYEPEHRRRLKFRHLIDRVLKAYPQHLTWDKDLLELADRHAWPDWAMESLLSLYVILESRPDGSERVWLWHYIAACVPTEFVTPVEPHLCRGEILQLELTSDGAAYVRSIASRFEEPRRENPYPSQSSTVGIATTAMSELYLHADAEADKIRRVRRTRTHAEATHAENENRDELPGDDLAKSLKQKAKRAHEGAVDKRVLASASA